MLACMNDSPEIPLSDAQLVDLNANLMADYDNEGAHADLEKYGDAFRFQLVAALQLSEWAEKLEADPIPDMDPTEMRGWVDALQEVAALLRQGHYLPGGPGFEDVMRDRSQ